MKYLTGLNKITDNNITINNILFCYTMDLFRYTFVYFNL